MADIENAKNINIELNAKLSEINENLLKERKLWDEQRHSLVYKNEELMQ